MSRKHIVTTAATVLTGPAPLCICFVFGKLFVRGIAACAVNGWGQNKDGLCRTADRDRITSSGLDHNSSDADLMIDGCGTGNRPAIMAVQRTFGVRHVVREDDAPSDHKRFATRAIIAAKRFRTIANPGLSAIGYSNTSSLCLRFAILFKGPEMRAVVNMNGMQPPRVEPHSMVLCTLPMTGWRTGMWMWSSTLQLRTRMSQPSSGS